MAYSDLIIDGNPLGLQFGKACDTDMAENSVSIDDGTIAVIARQELFNSVYADEIQDGSYTTSAEHDNIMNGSVCSIRPKLQIGEDIIGDAYLTEEDVETELADVGGVSGMTMQDLMKQTKGSISKTLDLILAPDANPEKKAPNYNISVQGAVMLSDSANTYNAISVSVGSTIAGTNIVTYAVDGNGVKYKDRTWYETTGSADITYDGSSSADSILFNSNADEVVSVSVTVDYSDSNFYNSVSYEAATKKGITSYDANTSWNEHLSLNNDNSRTVAKTGSCRVYTPWFIGYIQDNDYSHASEYIGDSVVNIRETNFNTKDATVNTGTLLAAAKELHSGDQRFIICMPTDIISNSGSTYPSTTKYNSKTPITVIMGGSAVTNMFVNTNTTFTYNGVTYNVWRWTSAMSTDGFSSSQFKLNN